MIEKGYPIVWIFLVFIIGTYIWMYTSDLHNENDRLFKIATEQNAIIEKQTEDIKQMNKLIETMFLYMEQSKFQTGPNLYPLTPYKRNDPI